MGQTNEKTGMELVAEQLVQALLDGESPKKFLRHLQLKKAAQAKAQSDRYRPPPVHTSDCHEWPEFEDFDDWQRLAAVEFQEIEGECAYEDHGARQINVEQTGKSFIIFEDHDAAEAAAKESVEQDINNEPDLFSQDFMERFINTERLRDALRGDEENSIRDQYDDDWSDSETKRDELIKTGDLEEDDFFDEESNELEITPELEAKIDDAYETFISNTVDSRLTDPMEYLRDIFGAGAAAKQAIEIVGIDTAAAAEAAVNEDGWEHFLARYDGNSYDLPSGAVYVRTD